MKRRSFLKGTLAGSTVAVAVSAGLLAPGQVLAAAWPKSAFDAKNVADALAGIGAGSPSMSGDISIKAPDIAENGAVVPITVETGIKGVTAIAILAEKNASPLAANFVLGKNADGYVSTRIKMVKTSNVIAVVSAGGKTFSNKKEVKVTIGGCGG